MAHYFVEYADDADAITTTSLTDRAKAMSAARRISKKTRSMVYVLDVGRTGHIAFASGYVDHKEGAAI
jgi:predicted alpha/beta hydrolase family esterase